MAASLVQTSGKIRTSGSGDVNVTMPSSFTAGNTAIASGCRYENNITGLTINGAASTVATQSANPGSSAIWIRYVASLSGGSNSATLDTPGTSDYNTFSIEEWSGLDTASPVDHAPAGATGSGTGPSISVNPTAVGNVNYGAWTAEYGNSAIGITAPGSYTSSWSEPDSNTYQGGAGAYRTAAATGSQAITWSLTNGGNWRAVGAVFKAATGGTAYTLAADSGAFTLTGTAASLLAGRKLTADAGSFTLTGTAANTLFGRKLTAEAASFALTGTDAALKAGRLLSAEAGAFTLTGTDATLTYEPAGSYTLTADPGSFALTGGDVGLIAARALSAEAGSFSLTGSDATLTYTPFTGYTLTAEPGVFTLTGGDAQLVAPERGSSLLGGGNYDFLNPRSRKRKEEEDRKKDAPAEIVTGRSTDWSKVLAPMEREAARTEAKAEALQREVFDAKDAQALKVQQRRRQVIAFLLLS